jgi:hypothetical protein
LQDYIENKFIPPVDKMHEVFEKTGKNMNDQFKELHNNNG